MGWHTLKRIKSGEKKSKESKVIENNVIKTVNTEERSLQVCILIIHFFHRFITFTVFFFMFAI